METKKLKAAERKSFSKSDTRKFRNEGIVPGVFYSKNNQPIHISVADTAINPFVFTSKTHLISLELEGHDEYECIIKDVQFHPVTDKVIHFDLLGLTKGEKIKLEIPVQLVGSPAGVKEGGVIQHVMHKVEVECLPRHIPEHIIVDISGLNLNDSIHISDLKYENIEFTDPQDSLIVQVTHAKIKEEVTPAAEAVGEETAEPEVIAKGKQEEKEEE